MRRASWLLIPVVGVALLASEVAHARSFVIQGDAKIGGYSVKASGTLEGAIKEFGRPTTLRRGRRMGRPVASCVARWRPLGVRITFYNLAAQDPCEPQYGYFYEAVVTGKKWRTAKGLRIGDPARRLWFLYSPRRFTGSWAWLLARYTRLGENGYYAAVEGKVLRGRVTAFRVTYLAGGD